MRHYNPSEIEPKWQQIWADDQRYHTNESSAKPKYYVTGMFPYPSGAGMHTGHFMEHSIVDAVARFRRALGYNVMYPIGWDSFGLPAENYAIKTGRKPRETTADNIANFKKQLRSVGASIDWSREINTSDPEYYKWTQWIFTKLFEKDLAYQKESLQWWCPKDKTVLANEQVIEGKCWRCDSVVVKKSMKQWFFRITAYAERLLAELPEMDWPDKIKIAQTNWIGKSEGAEITFQVDGSDDTITVFSTRPDTIFGATFLVLAPEHPLARTLLTDETHELVENYINDAVKKGGLMASSHVGGLSGAFIPVSEDEGMIDAVQRGSLSIEKLEAMTCVCSVGLDMIAIEGDTSAATISAIIADEAAIGMVNNKTTAVRVIPPTGIPTLALTLAQSVI